MRWLLPILFVGAAWAADWKAMLAPGPVQADHAELAGNCDACHSAFDGIPDERCLSCHEDLAGRISSQLGWHAGVSEKPCIACHTDHLGSEHSGTREEAHEAFSHDETGFALTGAHGRKDCADCHEGPTGKLAEGCVGCHVADDAHDSALGPACGSCHASTSWPELLRSLADHTVAMDGGHDGLQCADCHLHGDHMSPTVACNACHEEGHDGTVTPCSDCHQVSGWKPAEFDHGPCTCAFPGKHQTVECLACHADFDFTDTPTVCSGCHQPEGAHGDLGECATCHNALSWSDSQFDHNKQARFALDGGHLAVSCVQCHPQAGKFRGVPSECAGCHSTEAHPDFGKPCAECHVTESFGESTFDHATSGFALDGKHGTLPCADCHAPE